MSEPYPELERCLRCRALSPARGEWPLWIDFAIKTEDAVEVLTVRGPLCSAKCAHAVSEHPKLWAETYPGEPKPETTKEVEA